MGSFPLVSIPKLVSVLRIPLLSLLYSSDCNFAYCLIFLLFQEKWLEVLGCGVTEQEILKRNGKPNDVAWAFGLGLERLAMVLFDIPDIRLFWSNDERFTSQVFLRYVNKHP